MTVKIVIVQTGVFLPSYTRKYMRRHPGERTSYTVPLILNSLISCNTCSTLESKCPCAY